MKLMDFLKKNKLVRILERHSFRDKSGWTSQYLIDSQEVARKTFRKEENRTCLWRTETNTSDEGYAINSDKPYLVLEFNRVIKQYILLQGYKK